MMIEFFLPMIPPTVTQQEHKVAVSKKSGKIRFYDPPELKAAKIKMLDSVGRYAPEYPFQGPVQLITKWIWPLDDMPVLNELDPHYYVWKTTKPDTDNLIKMLKDCMTAAGFWKDDALVCSEVTEKFLAFRPGIYVKVVSL
ncbi:MAG: RusA family crossover junction endodeoxyribonuclease [Oscillospiraceae bacterium]|nr:RusA family crossover junction endodeoxyribonuclease [Oscillospiraceae bacterium]